MYAIFVTIKIKPGFAEQVQGSESWRWPGLGA